MARTSTADPFHVFSPLERYCHNLTMLAWQGAFSPLEGHDPAIVIPETYPTID